MLFEQEILEKIKAGKVALAFRRWKNPAAKAGGLQKTSIGVLQFDKIVPVKEEQLNNKLAVKAGYTDVKAVLKELSSRTIGTLYMISFHVQGEDPRLQLRKQRIRTKSDFQELHNRLLKMDKKDPWVQEVLLTIKAHPHTKAGDLAIKLHREKEWLKLHVRKLKNLGLTISFEPGYTLSPRGASYLDAIKKNTFGAL